MVDHFKSDNGGGGAIVWIVAVIVDVDGRVIRSAALPDIVKVTVFLGNYSGSPWKSATADGSKGGRGHDPAGNEVLSALIAPPRRAASR